MMTDVELATLYNCTLHKLSLVVISNCGGWCLTSIMWRVANKQYFWDYIFIDWKIYDPIPYLGKQTMLWYLTLGCQVYDNLFDPLLTIWNVYNVPGEPIKMNILAISPMKIYVFPSEQFNMSVFLKVCSITNEPAEYRLCKVDEKYPGWLDLI